MVVVILRHDVERVQLAERAVREDVRHRLWLAVEHQQMAPLLEAEAAIELPRGTMFLDHLEVDRLKVARPRLRDQVLHHQPPGAVAPPPRDNAHSADPRGPVAHAKQAGADDLSTLN